MEDGQLYDPIADLRQQVGDEIVDKISEDNLALLRHFSKHELDAIVSIENKYLAVMKITPHGVGQWGY